MMKLTILFFILMMTTRLLAQWSGTYAGIANGDNLVLILEQKENTVTGTLKDSYQTFDIAGVADDQQFLGTASESALQVVFDLEMVKTGNHLDCKLIFNMNGTTSESLFSLDKQEQKPTTTTTQVKSIPTKIPFPSGATFPTALTGTWTQNESYNSGSGDNFMGANFSQSMTFYADGTLADGGSSASMSGSNYSNQSSGTGTGKIEGVGWYAKQKKLYLIAYDNGSWTSVLVGSWYTENNHLLITGENGEKLLLSR